MKKLKVTLIGESQVGKTSLINQYVNNKFEDEYLMTIGNDKMIKEIEINENKVRLEIWDTIGQKDLRNANKIFMKNTNIALIVYDITNKKSFENLNEFYKELIKMNERDKMIIGIAANKSDLYENTEVNREEGEEYAKKINALYFESTATDHENVVNIFEELIKVYIENNKEKKNEDTTNNINNSNEDTTNNINNSNEDTTNNTNNSNELNKRNN
jgi:Ras-related protein Rab-6A